MNIEKRKNVIEGFLFASDKPLSVEKIIKLFPEDQRPEKDEVNDCIESLTKDFENHGIELKQVKSGYRFQVRQENASFVSKLWDEKPARYTRAMLETLALIVYRQPITRGEIEEIRGVTVSSHIIRTLMDREWIKIIGHRDVPGRPALYASTKSFLDYFNLTSLEDLPPLSEIKDLDAIATELDPEQNSALISAIREMQNENSDNDDSVAGEADRHDSEKTEEQVEDGVSQNQQVPMDILAEAVADNLSEIAQDQGEEQSISDMENELEVQISVATHELEKIEEEELAIETTQKSFSDLVSNFGKANIHSDDSKNNELADEEISINSMRKNKSLESDS